MKKVLFSATVDSHILHFHLPYLKMFKEKGYEVHVATNTDEIIPFCDIKHKVCFERSPFKKNNLKAIKQMEKILLDNNFDIVHTHTPMGSVVTRLAYKKVRNKVNTRMIYTAHGFHFYKGAPLLNWVLFYPVEKYLSKYTDTLITINKEDYCLAKKKFKKCRNVEYVPGVGIDEEKFNFTMTKREKLELRKSLGLKESDFVMIYPAEISKRKRHIWLINTLEPLLNKNRNIHLLLPGSDSLNGKAHRLVVKLKLTKQIHFLGYRTDIPKLLKISDLAISSAKQEGLPVNIMEAMYVGLPIVATDCRGNRDLVEDGENGYLIDLNDKDSFIQKIKQIYNSSNARKKFKSNNLIKIKQYILSKISEDMLKIYFNVSKARIAFLRTTALFNDSRASKEINTYLKTDHVVLAYGWNRNQDDIKRVEKCFTQNCNLMFYNRKAPYGSGIKNIFRMLSFNIWLYYNLRENIKKFDIIHACDFDTAYIGFKIAKKYKKKIIYDIYDYYVDCHNLSFLKKYIEKIDINIINDADCVFICTEQRRKQISKSSQQNVVIIHNSPYYDEYFERNNINKLRNAKYPIKIGYFGILQDDRLLIELTEKILNNSKYELYVGGFGKYSDYFEKKANQANNIFYFGSLEYSEVINKEKECDVLFATYNPKVQNHKYSAPNKVYEAMALGKPIIVCKGTGIDEMVENEKIGYSISYSADDFLNKLQEIDIKNNQNTYIQEKFKQSYSWSIMEKRMIGIIGLLEKKIK